MLPHRSFLNVSLRLATLVSLVLAAGCGADSNPASPDSALDAASNRGASESASFEGPVVAVDRAASSMTLEGDQVVTVDGSTIWDPEGDLFSFNELADAFDAGRTVRVEGDGQVQPNGSILATSIKAQVDGNENDVAEFEGVVQSIDRAAQSMTLDTDQTIVVDGSTIWDPEGDLFSFNELADAFDAGRTVRVEGDGQVQPNGDILATAIKAQVDDDENELAEFQGVVQSIDRAAQSMTLNTDQTIVVDGSTIWDPEGDVFSFNELADAFDSGARVRVEGVGQVQPNGDILATSIKAQVDEDEEVDTEMTLEIRPDEWRTSWASGSSSGSGGRTLEARIEGGDFAQIDPTSVSLEGPDGTIDPTSTRFRDDDFRAEFLKIEAIALVAEIPDGGTAEITVRGSFDDGTLWSLTETIRIRDDEDDDDDSEDDGEAEFEGRVVSVNRTDQTMNLADDTVVATDSSTQWDTSGDLLSFSALADAVEGGQIVEVEGEGDRLADGTILAKEIKAEIDD